MANAEAWITGEYPNQKLNLKLPTGATGPVGPVGPIGPASTVPGPANTLTVLDTVTGPETAGATGPQGVKGDKGDPGGLTQTAITTDTSLNNYITPGVYTCYNSAFSTLANSYPFASAIGTLMVLSRDLGNARTTQVFYPNTGGSTQHSVFYTRAKYTDSAPQWSPWRAFNSTRVDQTAGRAIYQWDDLNNREQLIYGDTGIRQVKSDLLISANGWDASTSNIYLRRNGTTVHLEYDVYTLPANTTPTAPAWLNIPAGFRSAQVGSITDRTAYAETGSSGVPTLIISRNNGAAVDFLLGSRAPTNIKFVRGGMSWTTNEAWPTSLPGTAVGTIPNV